MNDCIVFDLYDVSRPLNEERNQKIHKDTQKCA